MAVTDRSAVDPVRTTTIPEKRGAERREDDGLTLAAAKSTLAALTQAEPVPLDTVRHTISEADTTIPRKREGVRREDDGLTLAAAKSTLAALTQAEPVPLDTVRHTISEADLVDYEFKILCEELRTAIADAVRDDGFTDKQMAFERERIRKLESEFELRSYGERGLDHYRKLEQLARGIRRARATSRAGAGLAIDYLILGHEIDRAARKAAASAEGGR